EIERPGYRLCLRLESDQMECRGDLDIITRSPDASCAAVETEAAASVNATLEAETLVPAELIRILQQCEITQTIDFENLYHFCAAAAEGLSQQGG
ncbi:MAG: hypothetical protein L3J63_08190, partial [Geopsychrobacter sp.]|nr:hypothetical protein [Geopsychrobacter sp.]